MAVLSNKRSKLGIFLQSSPNAAVVSYYFSGRSNFVDWQGITSDGQLKYKQWTAGSLVVNSIRQEVAQTRDVCLPLDKRYRIEHDIVTQCRYCRRVRRTGEKQQVWDWVPAWVATQPQNTSHDLCEPCIGFHSLLQRTNVAEFAESFFTLPDGLEAVSGLS